MPSKAEIYRGYVYPLASKLDAEDAHDMAIQMLYSLQNYPFTKKILERALTEKGERYMSENLGVVVGGITFDNPLVAAAGFDKNGKAADALYALGFSSVVVGSVTSARQAGNRRPRIRRAPNENLVNSMGFPSDGVSIVKQNLEKYTERDYPIGISIGLNKDVEHDVAAPAYAHVAGELAECADYFEINVSSPNTPLLRDLQSSAYLTDIVCLVRKVSSKPVFLKISPDLSTEQLDEIIQFATDQELPIVATNTSNNATLKSSLGEKWEHVPGGVSGTAIENLSNRVIYHITRNSQVEVVGVGGVRDYDSAMRKFDAGAKLLQVYTGLVYEGPDLPSRLNRQIHEQSTRKTKQ